MNRKMDTHYKPVAGSDKTAGRSAALTAVALQDHLVRSLSLSSTLSGPTLPRSTYHPPRHTRPVVDTGRGKKKSTKVKTPEEKEFVLDPKPAALSLAQKFGLVEAPAKMLSEDEWGAVKKASNQREDSSQPCVICKEDFGVEEQVLLSCSHVFHRACIQAFERFAGKKCCPMCRREQYQTRVIHEGAKNHRNVCATRIQAAWRGHVVRCWYRKLRETVPPNDPRLRKQFYENKLASITERMVRSVDLDVAGFLHNLDQSLEASRDVFRQFDHKIRVIDDEEWTAIQLKAVERGDTDCPICLTALQEDQPVTTATTDSKPTTASEPTTSQKTLAKTNRRPQTKTHAESNKKLSVTGLYTGSWIVKSDGDRVERRGHRSTVLLSCSHVFHAACLEAFEEFAVGEHKFTCPVCRSHYQKYVS